MLPTGFKVFANYEYRLFWVSAAFSNFGMWALIYGRFWLMHSITESTLLVGLVTTATLAPVLIFSLWGGVIADRVNRLKLLRVTRGFFALLALGTAVLILLDVVRPWHILTIALITGIFLAFDIPSRAAMLPALVPRTQLASAIALYSLVFGGAGIIGPFIFAPVVTIWGLTGIFLFITLCYLLTVLTLMFMDVHRHKPAQNQPSYLKDFLEGIQYLHSKPMIVLVILIGIGMGVFGTSFEALLPAFAENILDGGIGIYSTLLLFQGIGGIITIILIASFSDKIKVARIYLFSGIAFGIALIGLSQAINAGIAVALLGVIGSAAVAFQTMGTTLMQTLTSDKFRGRVMSFGQLTWGATALGSFILGSLGEYFGVVQALSMAGILLLFIIIPLGTFLDHKLIAIP